MLPGKIWSELAKLTTAENYVLPSADPAGLSANQICIFNNGTVRSEQFCWRWCKFAFAEITVAWSVEAAGMRLSSFTTRQWMISAILLLVIGVVLAIGGCIVAAVGFGLSAADMYDYPNLWVHCTRFLLFLPELIVVWRRKEKFVLSDGCLVCWQWIWVKGHPTPSKVHMP